MKRRYCGGALLLLLWAGSAFAQSSSLRDFAKIQRDPSLRSQAQAIMDTAVRRAFGESAELPTPLNPIFQKPRAVFVTFESESGVRGCRGALFPRESSLAEEILQQARLALFHDPRHAPIRRSELQRMKVYVTAVGSQSPVRSIAQISPERDAVYLRSGTKGAVALPGEARTQRYLLAFLKAKAGIRKGEAFQLYRLESQSLELSVSPLGDLSH